MNSLEFNQIKMENLKIAIQKEGQLTEETVGLLRQAGFEFGSYNQRLLSPCRNFPLEIFYVRDDDIPFYVSSGLVDLGILGQDILNEERPKVKKILNLRFGYCSLVLAVPKESGIKSIKEMEGKTIATSYPHSTNEFFKNKKITVKVVKITGSVEIAPVLCAADGIVDITATGSSLALNNLRVVEKLYDSEAVLICNPKSISSLGKKTIIDKFVFRLKGILSARSYKYLIMNVPENKLERFLKSFSSLRLTAVTSYARKNQVTVQAVLKENVFWETVERLKQIGTSEIFVLPVEKIIS